MPEKKIKTKKYYEINRIGRFDEQYLEARFDDLRSDKLEKRQYDEKELKNIHEILEFLNAYKKYRKNSKKIYPGTSYITSSTCERCLYFGEDLPCARSIYRFIILPLFAAAWIIRHKSTSKPLYSALDSTAVRTS